MHREIGDKTWYQNAAKAYLAYWIHKYYTGHISHIYVYTYVAVIFKAYLDQWSFSHDIIVL